MENGKEGMDINGSRPIIHEKNKEISMLNKEAKKQGKVLKSVNKDLNALISKNDKVNEELVSANELIGDLTKENERLLSDAIYQSEEKHKISKELFIANQEKTNPRDGYEYGVGMRSAYDENIEKEMRISALIKTNHDLQTQSAKKTIQVDDLIVANIVLGAENLSNSNLESDNENLTIDNTTKTKRIKSLNKANKKLKTANAKQQEELVKSVYINDHDLATGLYNKKYYEEELIRIDQENNLPITIAICQITNPYEDLSKNNHYKMIADVLVSTCKKTAIVARIEESVFAVIMPNSTPYEANLIINQFQDELTKKEDNPSKILAIFNYGTKTYHNENIADLFASLRNQQDCSTTN